MNVLILKRIMSEKENILPSLRSQDWKTVKVETEKEQIINTYHNEQHHGIKRTNLCRSEKIEAPRKNTNRNSKPGLEIRLET